jgi:TPR repeat protein
VEQDFEQAFRWTTAAAEQGHVAAQFNLGSLYFEGQGVRRNRKAALDWYRQAGDGGHPLAQYNVAEMYYLGNGVRKDLIQAHAWASLAVENEHETAAELVAEIERRLSVDELGQARRQFARMKIGL